LVAVDLGLTLSGDRDWLGLYRYRALAKTVLILAVSYLHIDGHGAWGYVCEHLLFLAPIDLVQAVEAVEDSIPVFQSLLVHGDAVGPAIIDALVAGDSNRWPLRLCVPHLGNGKIGFNIIAEDVLILKIRSLVGLVQPAVGLKRYLNSVAERQWYALDDVVHFPGDGLRLLIEASACSFAAYVELRPSPSTILQVHRSRDR